MILIVMEIMINKLLNKLFNHNNLNKNLNNNSLKLLIIKKIMNKTTNVFIAYNKNKEYSEDYDQ